MEQQLGQKTDGDTYEKDTKVQIEIKLIRPRKTAIWVLALYVASVLSLYVTSAPV